MYRTRPLPLLLTLALLLAWPARAADLQVQEAAVATGIVDRAPVGAAASFPAEAERLYAYTRVVGAAGPTSVTHVWHHAGRVMAEVRLPVGGPDWRTWSSKAVLPAWRGEWLVEVVGEGGEVLASLPFVLE